MDNGSGERTHPVVLFDGVCNLCNGWVQFCLERDTAGELQYASLQSPAGRALLAECRFDASDQDSIVFVEADRCSRASEAVLRITRYLDAPYRWLWPLRVVPKPIRDRIYRFVANRRYRWFGKREQCLMPEPGWQSRFLEDGVGPTDSEQE